MNNRKSGWYFFWQYGLPRWLAVGWFKAVPGEEIDAQAHDDDEEYWFYGLSNGGLVTSQLNLLRDIPMVCIR